MTKFSFGKMLPEIANALCSTFSVSFLILLVLESFIRSKACLFRGKIFPGKICGEGHFFSMAQFFDGFL